MNIIEFIKERMIFLIINLIMFLLIAIFMKIAVVPISVIFILFLIWFGPLVIYMILEFIKYKIYLNNLIKTVDDLDKKYLLPEVIDEAKFQEAKIINEVLRKCNKSMHEKVKYYKDEQGEYREYIETWVHEIKTPIASAKLILENEDSNLSKRINYEMKRVEVFIEQVLYYARSSDVRKDYIIKEFSLRTVVMKAIKSNSRDFINKNIKLNIKEIQGSIFTDEKWIEFIINQIIINAVKFSDANKGEVSIYSKVNENNIILTIEDNGVGISEKDLDRVFEKGFTGENGRIFGKSTGIGLYLCKKLCDKLGIGISLSSKQGKGTRINIIFPQGKFTDF
ncbi:MULTISPECIES: HAMP domain-containing sensor histidine kinase [unclassified Clostridium]|uniref:sensor histidine kinase n=2 Tax=Clostridiaceae TaxID=31979 RepID=UPI001C8B208A|nr:MULTISPECIES: sensor histidine kinase [unclassified Clostridium]MBX9138980.1 HAMP domain-containing histidine kinase [Clostridium sp. K12(2020)]MBX9145790.1 HAMP domain-containing histidine kinase [Clostridium sp. K13]MDU2289701.1 sensor histidine kinase [Clostridium celatum]MDU4325142.1 sensor histidine kinase [Clostridium celatum]